MSRATRIAFVNTHPIQYFAPLYRYLNSTGEFAVSAIYLSDYSLRGSLDRAFGQEIKWDVDLLSGYNARFVPGAETRSEPKGFFSIVAPQIWKEVARGHFDAVIVHGHTPAAVLVAAAAAKACSARVFARAETHLGLSRSSAKRAIRRPAMGTFYRRLSGVLAIGSANANYYRAVGVPERRIFHVPYTVDNERFTQVSTMSADQRHDVRKRLGVENETPIVLYAAKFQPRKRPMDLLRAAAILQRDGICFHLAMAGSGELEGELRNFARDAGLRHVSFVGFVNQSELPRIYAASDIFVLPSENEPWGLAINEAMCAGLPVVASKEVGCAPDLIRDGVNGHTFDAGDINGLAAALGRILADKNTRMEMGKSSRQIIQQWSYAECLSGLRRAIAETSAEVSSAAVGIADGK